MLSAVSLLALAYSLGPPSPRLHARASGCSMEHRLNNYVLPGPMKPLGNQVLVKMRKVQEQTDGGLFVPTADTEKPKEGNVIAAGPGSVHPETGELIACPVKEGDLVLLSDFSGEKVDYDGDKHVFINADSLLGVFADGAMTVSGFTPIGDRILIEVAEAEQQTSTGIALALDEDDDDNSGKVAAVGAGKILANGKLQPVEIATGESVMYSRRAGADAKLEGKRFKIVFESQCICKW